MSSERGRFRDRVCETFPLVGTFLASGGDVIFKTCDLFVALTAAHDRGLRGRGLDDALDGLSFRGEERTTC
eukprot:1030810-Pyramimonas_sp.AAC.1